MGRCGPSYSDNQHRRSDHSVDNDATTTAHDVSKDDLCLSIVIARPSQTRYSELTVP